MMQYEVEDGDTLVTIAVKFGVKIQKLKRLNRSKLIGGDFVNSGMILTIEEENKKLNTIFDMTSSISPIDNNLKLNEDEEMEKSGPFSNFANSMISAFNSAASAAVDALDGKQKYPSQRKGNNSDKLKHEEEILKDVLKEEKEINIINEKEPWEKIDITLTGKAKILNILYANQLRRKLPRILQMENMVMLYSILENGSDLSSFYRNTMKVAQTILIIETVKGEIFGGFNSTEWKKSPSYCKF
jgi:hypothetical protein